MFQYYNAYRYRNKRLVSLKLATIRETVELMPEYGIKHLGLMKRIKKMREAQNNLPNRWSWDARNRIKAIHALGLVSIDRNINGYQLTQLGHELIKCPRSNEVYRGKRILTSEEKAIFKKGLLTNPPVVRVLTLLNEDKNGSNFGLSKYEIGEKLGFVGDPGFTHLDPNWVVTNGYSFNDKEGTADKWARTILSWLSQVGWVNSDEHKTVSGKRLKVNRVLPEVNDVLRYDAKRIPRVITSEMLCSAHHAFPKLVQKRRILILQALSEKALTINQLIDFLKVNDIETDQKNIKFEIINLQQAGIRILNDGYYYKINDKVILDIEKNLFSSDDSENESHFEKYIEDMVIQYEETIPIRLVDNLIRYGYNGDKGPDFESTVFKYFLFMGYEAEQLGQGRGRKADVIAKYNSSISYAKSYALIIDTKATSTKYRFSAGDIRKMKEYVLKHGPQLLSELIPNHAFVFISSDFIDNVNKPIQEIFNDTKIKGSALKVEQMLELGDSIKRNNIDISSIYENYATNSNFLQP